jgi:long-chain acyl-CoA synthetase
MNDLSKSIQQASSLPELFFASVKRTPTAPAQWYRNPEGYVPVTYGRLAERVRHVASGLIRAGVKPGDRVGLLMENIPEWAVCDYAILSIGAVTVPLYCSFRAQDMAFVLDDAGARIVLVSRGKVLKHLLEAVKSCPHVKAVYALEGSSDDKVLHKFSELESVEVDQPALEKRMGKLARDTLATLVYTSGTTGNPKGVMLTHGNIMANLEAIPLIFELRADDKMLSFLPLAHSLERMAGHFLPYSVGFSVAFAERPDTVAKNLLEARPTILIAVPRLLEVVMSRILGKVAKEPALKRKMFHLFLDLAGRARRSEKLPWWGGAVYRMLDQLVGQKIRGRFGGRLRFIVSGGAPLSVEVAEFFEAVGLPVLEGYGLTESAPLISVNPLEDRRIGTIGKAVAGVEVRIAEDGEILARGANIMRGYWKLPKETKKTVVDGWLHTGDIGEIDADGYIRITDRKKDLIVNSGGENIAPQRIESLLVSDELIEQVIVYGDKKPYLVAMVVPSREGCETWAREQGLPRTAWEELAISDILHKELQNRISMRLKGLAPHEQVRRLVVRSEPFSIEDGLLTPTMKIKRRKVYEQFRDVFESLYSK